MGGGFETTFPGIFSCSFDESIGKCVGRPNTLVDSTFIDGDRDRGVDLSNIRLSGWKNKVFALRTDTYWEILWAPLDTDISNGPAGGVSTMLSYFRLPKLVYTDKSKGHDCGKYTNGTRFAYYEVLPVAFTVDENDDVFISWEGFYQDCEDSFESENGLVWSIGVNKVDRNCVLSNDIQDFSKCTSPHSIFYKGWIGKDRRLGNGIDIGQSPINRPLFYLTIVNRAFSGGNLNELWVAPPGLHKRPTIVPTANIPAASPYQTTRIIPDIASIKLSLDENRQARSICQTVYDDGVYCYDFEIEDDGVDIVASSNSSEPMFVVTKEQVAESCTMDTNVNGGEDYMSGLTTGLEVVWGSDHIPDIVLFGCYGRLPDQGNMTAVFRDGSVNQIYPGAYPGSLLFGIDVTQDGGDFYWSDEPPVPFDPQMGVGNDDSPTQQQGSNAPSAGIVVLVVFASILSVATVSLGIMMYALRKPRTNQRQSIGSSISDDSFSVDETTGEKKKKQQTRTKKTVTKEKVSDGTSNTLHDVERGDELSENSER
jgi:hypothetical protein